MTDRVISLRSISRVYILIQLAPLNQCTQKRAVVDEIEDASDLQYPAIVLKYVDATLLDASVTKKLNRV